MDDLDITPPAAPGFKPQQQRKKGFFSRLFSKEHIEDLRVTNDRSGAMNDDDFDISEIRRKAGLDSADIKTEEASQVLPDVDSEPVPIEEELEPAPMKKSEALDADFLLEEQTQEPSTWAAPEDTQTLGQQEQTQEPSTWAAPEDTQTPGQQPAQQESAWATEVQHDAGTDERKGSGWDDDTASAAMAQPTEWADTADEAFAPAGTPTEKTPEITFSDHSAEIDELGRLHEEIVGKDPLPTLAEEKGKKEKGGKRSAKQEVLAAEPESIVVPDETPAHHKEIEKIFAQFQRKHEAIDKQLKKLIEPPAKIPEWKYQKTEVKPDHYFKLKNGQEVKNFKDLLDALDFIDDETFKHHVTEEKNDFAEWVQHILQEEQLAERIRNKTAREELLKILRKHEENVLKELGRHTKQLEEQIRKKQGSVKKVKELEMRIRKLTTELRKKSDDLAALRTQVGQKVKRLVDEHTKKQLEKRRTELDARSAAVAERENALAVESNRLEKLAGLLDKREQALAQREDRITKARSDAEAQHQQYLAERAQMDEEFARRRRDADEWLKRADEIKAMKAAVEKQMAEVKALTKHSKEAARIAVQAERRASRERQMLAKEQEKLDRERDTMMQLKRALLQKERTLVAREAQLKRDRESIEPSLKKVAQERAALKEMSKREIAMLADKRKEVERLVRELEAKAERNEKLVRDYRKMASEVEKEKSYNIKRDKEITRREKDMERRGFKSYIESKISSTVTGEFTDEVVPKVEEITNVKLYRLIDQCKEQLDRNELRAAKSTYNTLREEFSRSKLSSHEKSVLYNAIRELYDDIHLAMLNQ